MASEKSESSTTSSEACVSTYSYLTEEEKKMNEDYEWCLNDPEVRRLYGEQVVVAHQRHVWGAGRDHDAAWDDAIQHPDCPHPRACVFVVVPPLLPASSNPSTSEV